MAHFENPQNTTVYTMRIDDWFFPSPPPPEKKKKIPKTKPTKQKTQQNDKHQKTPKPPPHTKKAKTSHTLQHFKHSEQLFQIHFLECIFFREVFCLSSYTFCSHPLRFPNLVCFHCCDQRLQFLLLDPADF